MSAPNSSSEQPEGTTTQAALGCLLLLSPFVIGAGVGLLAGAGWGLTAGGALLLAVLLRANQGDRRGSAS